MSVTLLDEILRNSCEEIYVIGHRDCGMAQINKEASLRTNAPLGHEKQYGPATCQPVLPHYLYACLRFNR